MSSSTFPRTVFPAESVYPNLKFTCYNLTFKYINTPLITPSKDYTNIMGCISLVAVMLLSLEHSAHLIFGTILKESLPSSDESPVVQVAWRLERARTYGLTLCYYTGHLHVNTRRSAVVSHLLHLIYVCERSSEAQRDRRWTQHHLRDVFSLAHWFGFGVKYNSPLKSIYAGTEYEIVKLHFSWHHKDIKTKQDFCCYLYR